MLAEWVLNLETQGLEEKTKAKKTLDPKLLGAKIGMTKKESYMIKK